MYEIGIVILNYNTADETVSCIDSIKKYTTKSYKIYIVDNCSKDDSAIFLSKKYSGDETVSFIQNCNNGGYSAGNNIGIKMAEKDGCEFVFIINSDIELLNDSLAIMVNTLKTNDTYMIVGPSVIDNRHVEVQLPRTLLTFSSFLAGRHPFCSIPYFKSKSNRMLKISRNPMAFVGSVSGCCFGIRTKDISEIGYLDENVFLYYEEEILAYKMQSKGKMAVVDFRSKVWHKENVSTKKEGSAFVQYHRWISVLYLLKRYVGIGKFSLFLVALWNIVTWLLLSVVSKPHRKMLRNFCHANLKIVLNKK